MLSIYPPHSYAAKLPVINENCPACFEAPQERRRVKKLLAKEEANSPHVFGNIRRAITPLMDPEVLTTLGESLKSREAKGSRSIRNRNRKQANGQHPQQKQQKQQRQQKQEKQQKQRQQQKNLQRAKAVPSETQEPTTTTSTAAGATTSTETNPA